MSSSHDKKHALPPMDLSGWGFLPVFFMVFGGLLSALGLAISWQQNELFEFGCSWLLAFMFYYSLAIGALFLVMVHHLSGAAWSLGIRRFCEHIASLLGWPLIVMFIPVAVFAKSIYSWMSLDPATNNLVAAKAPVFTMPGFYVTSAVFFALLWFLSSRLSTLLATGQNRCPGMYSQNELLFRLGYRRSFAPPDLFRGALDEGRAI